MHFLVSAKIGRGGYQKKTMGKTIRYNKLDGHYENDRKSRKQRTRRRLVEIKNQNSMMEEHNESSLYNMQRRQSRNIRSK